MSYEYKDVFIESISNFIYPGKIFDDSLSELDHVYEQAAKADEYEVKAKALDNLVDVAYWHFERIHPDDDNRLQYESFYDDIRDEFKKLESGESECL